MKVAVVGAGAAGTAAAWQAARRGAHVTLFHDRPGATALHSGALDWDEVLGTRRLDADILAFATAFDAWAVGPTPAVVVTDAGRVRSARGADVALLDLAPLAGRSIAVVDAGIDGWDGAQVARAAAASPWARDTATSFHPVAVDVLESKAAALLPAFDVAASFDDEPALERLIDRLRAAGSAHDAWLLGPWLGTNVQVAENARRRLGKPCGETTSPPGGPAGARFEASRAALLATVGAVEHRARVVAVARRREGWMVHREGGDIEGPFAAVVLAIGGVAAGGIVLDDPAPGARGRFRSSVEAPMLLALDGRLLDSHSTLHGVDFAASGVAALVRIGVFAEDVRVAGAPGLYVAGDMVASRPRTALEAVRAGVHAGAAAIS